MSLSTEASSPVQPNNKVSPCSDKRFWSALNQRFESQMDSGNDVSNGSKRIFDENDSLLLFKGFDSFASSLSLLTANIHCALQGARELAKPSTPLTDTIHNSDTNNNTETTEHNYKQKEKPSGGDNRKGTKRKLDAQDCSNNQGGDNEEVEISDNKKKQKHQTEINHLNKIKNLAIAMATKSASLARELKSVRSEMSFLKEKCALLEEKNERLRDGFDGGVRPDDDDDLVRLQLEALLAEKSRLATENANLSRENQCLRQLVEYHQFASEDLSASYEQVIQGISLDFSSPIAQDEEDHNTPKALREAFDFDFPTFLDKSFAE